MDEKELSLTPDEEKLASVLLEHSATYVMVIQLNEILEDLFPNRLQHEDHNIRDAAQIIRLIRNAFAHDPFSPTWQISSSCKNQTLRVENIVSLNTKGLDGKSVNRMDYGGPISLLRLLQFLKQNVKD